MITKMLKHIQRVCSQMLLHKSRRIQSQVFLPFVHVLAGTEGMYYIKLGYSFEDLKYAAYYFNEPLMLQDVPHLLLPR